MPVELRKRKAPTEPTPTPAAKKAAPSKPAGASKGKPGPKPKAKAAPAPAPAQSKSKSSGSASSGPATVGSTISLPGFGGEILTNDDETTDLAALVASSKSGVALLAYPKASTPGCTTQVCLARDAFEELTSTGLAIYGISRDSPKANTTFKTKQKLPYGLLCDKEGTLISAIGLKKAPAGTQRGVFVVDKDGKVLAAQAASPKESIEVVRRLVGGDGKEKGEVRESKAEKKVEEGKDPKEVDEEE